MAKYQLTHHGWPINGGATLIPVGAILDSADWKWHGVALPFPPPINAIPQDQEAFDVMVKHYERHRILTLDSRINRQPRERKWK
jgi:hypothetical protein